MSAIIKKGKVIIAGAGPGDPELVTLKTLRYLQEADVVLTDRLVSNEILNCYVNSRAEIIYVGKQCRKGSSTPQATINDLMVEHASANKLVVRLKGGDVSIFSNVLDELETLVSHNIPYEIIPGVTAALGASAYAGIPLTARGYSTAVRFVTYYKSDVVTDEYWKELANTTDTIVFYMSAETLGSVVKNLLLHGIANDRKLAVIGQATTPEQKISIYDLKDFEEQDYISPTIAIIGRVVELSERFSWLTNNEKPQEYFKPSATRITPHEKTFKI
jgi:uroporphyrin-III C-methyltransferase/precorrin-2 dehydrogenase/sirohydrochlorin ferrochelatase/uroporphyrin-III C-methyltransferase